MIIDWTLLDTSFVVKIQNLLNLCEAQGYTFVSTMGFRSLAEENRLWRRSRTAAEVAQKIAALQNNNCNYLADSLEGVGAQANGLWATDTIGGLSWHNWGEALDVLCKNPDGTFIEKGDNPCYLVLSNQATALGMRTGLSWGDAGHIQMNPAEIPTLYSLKYVNDYFKERNGI